MNKEGTRNLDIAEILSEDDALVGQGSPATVTTVTAAQVKQISIVPL